MIDPLGGIIAFLGLALGENRRQRKAAEYLREQRSTNETDLTPYYPEPHRDPATGKIVIENAALYNDDLMTYGAVQTMKWVEQGKYNLSPEELEEERERINKKFDELFSL